MVKSLLASAGDMGSIPGQGTNIPPATEQLSTSNATTEPVLQVLKPKCRQPMLHKKSHSSEKLTHHNEGVAATRCNWIKSACSNEDPASQKYINNFF